MALSVMIDSRIRLRNLMRLGIPITYVFQVKSQFHHQIIEMM